MKNILCLSFAVAMLFSTAQSKAQYYYYNSRFYESNMIWEIGASAVGMNGLTDLGGKKARRGNFLKDLNWQNTRPGLSLFGKFLYNQAVALRLETTFGKIAAADSILKNKINAPGRYQRNLQVQSNILEGLLLAEVYPLTLLSAGEHPVRWLAPYLIAGVGYFHFNPTADYGNGPLKLQPLHTEGQGFPEYPERKPYALNQWNIPLGVGFKYEITALLVCGIELLYRKLFTDYLDDVSKTYIDPGLFYRNLLPAEAAAATLTADPFRKGYVPHKPGEQRGNPANNDAYLSFNLKAAIVIGRERR